LAFDVKLFDDWDAVEKDAGGALDRPHEPSLFHRLDWFRLLARHCPPAGELLAARAREGAREAWLFLTVNGRRASAYANWYSLRAGPSGDPDGVAAIARTLKHSGLNEIDLAPVEDGAAVAEAFRTAGWIVFGRPATANWRADTEGLDFQGYWGKRPSRLRNTAKRKAKAASLSINIHRDFDAETWKDYEAVYRISWKPEEGSPPFLRALAEQEGAAGTLRLGLAYKDGSPLAAQLWLVENGVATIHKLAYAEAARDLSPGTVLSMEMFKDVIDRDQVSLIDFGTGDDGYKRDWMDNSHMLERVSAYNPATPAGLVSAARASLSPLVRRLRRG
jgi:hypothetical protein